MAAGAHSNRGPTRILGYLGNSIALESLEQSEHGCAYARAERARLFLCSSMPSISLCSARACSCTALPRPTDPRYRPTCDCRPAGAICALNKPPGRRAPTMGLCPSEQPSAGLKEDQSSSTWLLSREQGAGLRLGRCQKGGAGPWESSRAIDRHVCRRAVVLTGRGEVSSVKHSK